MNFIFCRRAGTIAADEIREEKYELHRNQGRDFKTQNRKLGKKIKTS
jgi:hypothetical protein